MLKLLLVFVVFAIIVNESQSTPSPHHKNKNDPYKPVIRLLKELRKQRKYQHKYGGGSSFGGSRENDYSEESGDYHPFHSGGFPGGSSGNRPSIFPGGSSGNRPSFFPSDSSGGNFGEGGGNIPSLPFPGGGANGGGSQDPFQQASGGGLDKVLQGLSQLTLGQLLQGAFS